MSRSIWSIEELVDKPGYIEVGGQLTVADEILLQELSQEAVIAIARLIRHRENALRDERDELSARVEELEDRVDQSREDKSEALAELNELKELLKRIDALLHAEV